MPLMKMAVPIHVTTKRVMVEMFDSTLNRMNSQIFNYDTQGNGLGGFLTFLLAEALAQVVNFFVQMKWVFKSDSSFKDAAWKYVILAVIIVVVNLVLPGYVTGLCQGWGMGAGIAGTIASVVNTLLAVIVSYPLLKFWVMPKSGDKKETAK